MLKIREAIIVEGRYDKNKLLQIVDAVVIETEGFGVFSNKEKASLIRKIAEKRGIIVLTDPDGAGFVIRNRIKGMVPDELVKHAYIPDIAGKEKRKTSASKEGKLGVEGVDDAVIINALMAAGATVEGGEASIRRGNLTKSDMYTYGFSGGKDSERRRMKLKKMLNLPEKLSSNALLDVLNALYTREEFEEIIFKSEE